MSDLNGHERDNASLSAADAAAVDAILDGVDAGSTVDAARQERAAGWLKVLDGVSVPAVGADLVQRTLQAVRDADRMKIPAHNAASDNSGEAPVQRSRWRRRLAEFGAMGVAALLFVSVLIAGLNQTKKSQIRVACVANMKAISTGMLAYSSSAGGNALPMVAMPSNHNWLRGTADGAFDNASHLLPLITANYVPKTAFYCPGTPPAAESVSKRTQSSPWDIGPIGYSYRNMYGVDKPKWDGTAAVILTDRNPLFADGATITSANINSNNHDGRGNNVLHADGSVNWATSPNIGPANDNIWTIGDGKDRLLSYNGTETPASLADVIVCP